MRFHVVGTGAIGTLFAHHLRRVVPPQHRITLLHRNQRQARIARRTEALTVERSGASLQQSGFYFEASVQRQWLPDEGTGGPHLYENTRARWERLQAHYRARPIEALVVCTKAQNTLGALRRLRPRITPATTIVLLQNGMGVYERLVDELFADPHTRPQFVLATNTHGAWRRGHLHVVHAGVGRVEFGIVPDPRGRDYERALHDAEGDVRPELRKPRLKDICDPPGDPEMDRYLCLRNTVAALLAMDLDTRWRSIADVETAMRRKLVVNAVINPLTALLGCRNGDVFINPESHNILRRVCNEAHRVFAAQLREESRAWREGSVVDASGAAANPDGDEMMEGDPLVPTPLQPLELMHECMRVAKVTRDNHSSMLQDIRAGQDTEIDFLNGYIIELGREFGVPTPTTEMLKSMVKLRTAIPLDQIY